MRLRQIRISGFKSFADLTTIEIPSSIVGIVGPNGCGKSNVIEAVQWALGEGKASDLRCKSMSELIFAGADNRKPAGRAMVELVFDNSDGTLQGPWGAYTDISVKRILTRDNTSSYLINNQQVRATDVKDLFMGTGLGANSYAIISQGMVTEFAKDSPEKRREYLEEAAGVSKYKKRRKEAESKLASTRANLERVSDLQVTRRDGLKRLEAEAQVAMRYRQLQDERTAKESLWWFTQMVEAQNTIDRINAQATQVRNELTQNESDYAGRKEALGEQRASLNEANITVLGKTQALAQVDKSVSAVEGNIRSIIERRELMKTQLESYTAMIAARNDEIKKQADRIHTIVKEREEKEELAESAQEREAALDEARLVAQEKAEGLRANAEQLQKQARELEGRSRELSLEMARLSKSKEELSAQLQKYQREAAQTQAPDENRYRELQEELQALKEESAALAEEREQAQATLEEGREELARVQQEIHAKEQKQAAVTARLHALTEMQQKAQAGDRLNDWLQKQGLSELKRLFELVQVDPLWAKAVEAVLRERVNALGITRLDMAAAFAVTPPPAKLTFFCTEAASSVRPLPEGFESLADKVQFKNHDEAAGALKLWLSGYALAEDLAHAVAARDRLPEGARFVTPQGHTVDAVSVNFWADDASGGVLSRRAELEQLQAEEAQLRRALEELHRHLGQCHLQVSDSGNAVRETSARFEAVRRRESELALEVTRLAAAIEAHKQRREELQAWIEETKAQLEEVVAGMDEADERFSALDEELAQRQQKAEDARLAWEVAQEAARRAEQDFNVFSYTQRELELTLKTLAERLGEAQRAQMLAQNEQEELKQKFTAVKEALAGLDEDSERAGLEELLVKRETAQEELSRANEALQAREAQVAELEKQLQTLEEEKRVRQNRLGELLTKRQQHEVDFATVKGRLEEMNFDEAQLRERYELERPKLNALRLEVERLAREMAALGAVNHAALEQLKAQTEEVERIDREVEDLQQAIVTIEAAIKKIDSETRTVLKETFDRVNLAFNEKFTQLFQGGHARLEMTSDDALEAGIEMFANPPGKHNHSIRQLSGGELTLTAIALVFAFFTLNPAPFCLLDEIDAPLDEANQERLSRLVGAMSENTQFMMITHHRVTMEHTNQLIGVTMKEPGVSRVVSVDIAEASQYAQKTK